MTKIRVSAPGKIHLLGEHAVVYGMPAILSAVNKRLFVEIYYSVERRIFVDKIYKKQIISLLAILEKEIKRRTNIREIRPYSIEVKSEAPIGSGVGSSAALSASITAALLLLLKAPWDKKTIFDIAYEGEKFFHGNPSGGDLATVIEGGFLWFRKEFEFLKTFSSLPFKPHKNIKQFILINSGKPKESTREMVEKVAKLKKQFPQKVKSLFFSQEELTKNMALALKDGDEESIINCIKMGEYNLEKLGVVGRKARLIIRKIEKLGGAAKISGAGGVKDGSGILLAYHKSSAILNKFFLHFKLESSKIALGEEGLREE